MKNNSHNPYENDGGSYADDEDEDFAVGDPSSDDLYDDYIKTRAPSRAGGAFGGGLKTAKPRLDRGHTTRGRSLSVADLSGAGLARGKTAARSSMYDPWKARTVTFYRNGDV